MTEGSDYPKVTAPYSFNFIVFCYSLLNNQNQIIPIKLTNSEKVESAIKIKHCWEEQCKLIEKEHEYVLYGSIETSLLTNIFPNLKEKTKKEILLAFNSIWSYITSGLLLEQVCIANLDRIKQIRKIEKELFVVYGQIPPNCRLHLKNIGDFICINEYL
ncbi:hypothetical protein AJ85_08295 [Alkalihalobacillus alcalophilus ATCC 27647 = CGMCC 1.3604]|uniref:Uncharacterized protein n=1 Tax=Alkalihalobacillus alcalophilus ATCC 27647 = CGMCC 1.3604 TaxID=1218173 RepID=A0A094WRB4_ALKAL|nr:hypothetical protein [Alkalihalobacillus alcalophilus]KGA98603.1 hypothetical protein BALCAV_0203710 [Alkalihalobacillus alcalophilus ATCC 27647 = CGMCC 1.3604]MED1560446.1 hypothetical protein [Alkalihalobacillus alcalophilus]THG90894.1 hypothetical protein AJ85_08295 [Alkalihalobacillus alcalophilus ATCC 27647 = CGMCC 1.3604]